MSTTTTSMIKVVDRVSLAELLVEADVVLRAVSSKSFTSSRKKKFDEKKECVVDDDDENDDDDEDTTNAPKGRRRGFSLSFSTALTKRLRGAYLSFCSDTTATTTREKKQDGTLTATTTGVQRMNSKDWLAVVTESRLLSKSFSARKAMRCFEDASIGCERDDGDGMMSRRGIGFEQFLKLLAEDVAKAYDVDAKVVGKRVVATAYAIERRKEEEERRKGGTCDDDDDDDAGTDDEKHANAYASSRQRMMTTTPLSTTFSKSANSGGSTSSWRVRAERHANRYGRITDDHVVAATRRRKKSAATICDDDDDENNVEEYRFADDDTKIEDRVAHAFETVLCQSSSESSRSSTTISEREFIKICIACALIGNGFTKSDCLDIAFSIGARETGEIDRRAFVRGLRKIAVAHRVPFSDVGKRVLAVSRAL